MARFQTISIVAAFFCIGYVASLFLTYSFIVMPGLAAIDDRAFVAAFQGLETRFQNGNLHGYDSFGYGNIPALIAFPGAIIFSLIAVILNRKKNYAIWIVSALVFFILGMITTLLYNLPSNVVIFAAGDPSLIDVTQVRQDFNEGSWLRWNHFRALTTILALTCLTRVLYMKYKSRI